MQAGVLDSIITVQRYKATQDAYGEELLEWRQLCQLWAQATAMKGTESFMASQFVGQCDYTFRIRWRGDISVKDRILYNGKYFDILGVLEKGRRVELLIYAKTRSDDGE